MANLVNELAKNEAGIIIVTEWRYWDVNCRLLSSVEKAKRNEVRVWVEDNPLHVLRGVQNFEGLR